MRNAYKAIILTYANYYNTAVNKGYLVSINSKSEIIEGLDQKYLNCRK